MTVMWVELVELQYFIGWVSKDLGGTSVVKYLEFDQNLSFIIRAKLTDKSEVSSD